MKTSRNFPVIPTRWSQFPIPSSRELIRLNREGILSDQGAVDENLVRSRTAYWRCRRSGLRVAMAFLLAWG